MSNVAPLTSPFRLSALACWSVLLAATLVCADPVQRDLSAQDRARVSEVALLLAEQPVRTRGAQWNEGGQPVAKGTQVRFPRYQLDLMEFSSAAEASAWASTSAGSRFVHQEGTYVVTGFGPGLPAPERLTALAKLTRPAQAPATPATPAAPAPAESAPTAEESQTSDLPQPEASAKPDASDLSSPSSTPSIGIVGALQTAPSTYASPLLKRGDRDSSVEALQYLLNQNSTTQIAKDRTFGAATESALRRFQGEHGLPVTGVADQQTWDKLRESPEALRPALGKGAKGESVEALQELLNSSRALRGLPPISKDGDFGAGTERALEDYQREHGLPATGEADKATWAALSGEDPVVPASAPTDYTASPLLSQGHNGEPVRALHHLLNKHREATGRPVVEGDGQFGPATEQALRTFQQEQGLPESGVADPATWAALRSEPEASEAAPSLRRGDQGEDVAALQSRLNRHREPLNRSPIAVDSQFGANTETAVRDFQSNQGLPATGVVDPNTLQGLNEEPTWENPDTTPLPPAGTGLSGLKIAIDSGHGVTQSGSFDPGAVNSSNGITEYELNRQVATRVASLLRAQGAQVTLQVYPRGSPRRSLFDKGSIVAQGHHVFVSIHHNAYNRQAQGSETLVHQSRGTTSSHALASAIQRNMVRELWAGASARDRGVKRAGLGVLRGAHSQVGTAVLVEGFFLDPSNVTSSVAAGWVEREARGIAAGIVEYWSAR